MKFVFPFILMFSFFIASCTDTQPIVGGSDSDNYVRETKLVKGTVNSYTSGPVGGVDVYLIKSEIADDKAVFSTINTVRTNESGEWQFTEVTGNYSLLIKENQYHSSSLKKISISDSNSTSHKIFLADSSKNLEGRVFTGDDLSVDVSVKVFVMGTRISSEIESDGRYSLKNVPTGDCDLLFTSTDGNFISTIRTRMSESQVYLRDIALPKEKTDNLPISEYSDVFTVMPIEYAEDDIPDYYDGKNFENVEYLKFEDNQLTTVDVVGDKILSLTSFNTSTPNAFIMKNFKSKIDRDVCESNFNSMISTYIISGDTVGPYFSKYESGPYGQALYAIFDYGNTTTALYGGTTIFFDKSESATKPNGNVDLTEMKSVNFYMKGSGNIKILLQDSLTIIKAGGALAQFEKEIALNDQWAKFEIPIEDFTMNESLDPESLELYSREEALKRIEYIKFLTVASPGDTISYSLDEVSISGLTLSDLMKQRF